MLPYNNYGVKEDTQTKGHGSVSSNFVDHQIRQLNCSGDFKIVDLPPPKRSNQMYET